MLHSSGELQHYAVLATDGEIGTADDLYFDDQRWTVRYLVINTGDWLSGQRVLLSPLAVVAASREERDLRVALTRAQVEGSPPIDTHRPVSRQHERELAGYYGWPLYWGGAGMWGAYAYPQQLLAGQAALEAEARAHRRDVDGDGERDDPHLRSAREVIGYGIRALDGELGHVEDVLVDDEDWAIRYLVVDTRDWLPGRKVLVTPQWITAVSWEARAVAVDLTRDTIERGPAFAPSLLGARAREHGSVR